MRLVDRLADRYRSQGYYEGLASGAAVLVSYGSDGRREGSLQQIVAQAQGAYATNGVVFACILARMMLFAEARFTLQALNDKHLFGLPGLGLLETPWPNGSTGELLARMEQDVSLAGNAFVARVADDRLVRLPPDEVTIVSEVVRTPYGSYREIIGYDFDPLTTNPPGTGPTGGELPAQLFTVEQTAHWSPYPDPQANFRGMSWLTPVMREIEADSGMTAYKAQYLERGVAGNVVVKYTHKLRPDTIDSVSERISAKYGGVGNSFRALVLDQGADASVLGNSFSEMDFSAVQGAGENRICVASGVPSIVVGLAAGLDASTYSNYQQAMRKMADMTARPMWRSACAALQKLVPGLPPATRLWVDLSDIAALRQGEIERAQTMQVKAAALLSLIQAGYTRESSVVALEADDLTLLVKDPAALAAGGRTGQGALPAPQTPATKIPAPAAFAPLPVPNGSGRR